MRKLISILCIFMAIVGYNKANAVDLEFSALIASKHLGNESFDYNEINPGLFVYMHELDYYKIVGVYQNSFNDTSVFVGVGKEWFDGYLCAEAGLVSGYEKAIGGVQVCTVIPIMGHRIKFNFTPGRVFGIAKSDVISIQYVF